MEPPERDTEQPGKERTLSLLYGGVPTSKGKRGSCSKPQSNSNPSIELIDPIDVPLSQLVKHPPPPRCLPLAHFKKPATVRKTSNASPSESVVSNLSTPHSFVCEYV